jgi:Tol biopolymer transport system component
MALSSLGGKEDILVLKTDGTGLRRLTDDGFRNRGPTFSPDGRKVLFYTDRAAGYNAWTVDVDGIGLSPVTRSRVGNTSNPVWSPDGRTIAAINPDGRRLLLLPYPRSPEDPLPEPAPPPGEGLGCSPHSWSPDSRKVAATALRANGSSAGVLVFDVEKESYKRVTETGSGPLFLRDGRRIAYRDGNALKIVDTVSGRTREILRGDARRVPSSFALSPDDKDLFVLWSVTQADLWLMDLGPRK